MSANSALTWIQLGELAFGWSSSWRPELILRLELVFGICHLAFATATSCQLRPRGGAEQPPQTVCGARASAPQKRAKKFAGAQLASQTVCGAPAQPLVFGEDWKLEIGDWQLEIGGSIRRGGSANSRELSAHSGSSRANAKAEVKKRRKSGEKAARKQRKGEEAAKVYPLSDVGPALLAWAPVLDCNAHFCASFELS